MATVAVVAKKAGVSVSTAVRIARSLRTRQTRTVGVGSVRTVKTERAAFVR